MKLNVLQLLPALEVGGVERGTLEIAQALIQKGYGSHVISAGGRMVEQLKQEGSEHLSLKIGKKSPLTFLYYRKIKKYILDNNINVVHVRSRMPAWVTYLALLAIPKQKRPLLVSTIHGPYSVNFYSKIMMRSDCLIAISEYIMNYILTNYPDTDKNKITLIHRGVNNQIYNCHYNINNAWSEPWADKISTDTKVITLPGRITRWKGQADFIDIINQLLRSGMNIHGVIAGGAEPRRQAFLDELNERVKILNLDEHISFIGQRSDMKEIMKASDLVVSLAKIPEAFGRTALEALALGTPVVAYDHGGAHEVLKELFPNGLCKANDLEDAGNKISYILQNNFAIKHNELFTLHNMIEQTIHVYENAILNNK